MRSEGRDNLRFWFCQLLVNHSKQMCKILSKSESVPYLPGTGQACADLHKKLFWIHNQRNWTQVAVLANIVLQKPSCVRMFYRYALDLSCQQLVPVHL